MMHNGPSPLRAIELIATLADVFRHQGREDVVELLESAHARFDLTDYDNWNGGTSTWALRLEVPLRIFATVEPQLAAIESDIGGKLSYWDRQFSNDHFGEVTISPISAGSSPVGQRIAPSDMEVRRIWADGRFRLFLSHVSKHKGAVSNLKGALRLYGIDAFVAHEDIVPSLEWQREIELALRSMHSLAALITPDFHESSWTDQEVGWALGREISVLPIRLGTDPYGLLGKIQGISGALTNERELASRIAAILLGNRRTAAEMRRALFGSLAASSSPEMALTSYRMLAQLTDVNDEERRMLWAACNDNRNVASADGVVASIHARFGKPSTPKLQEVESDIPF